ncbi:IS110 family RNA-guided transposase [Hamadaea tsunoensis]|uniref:IS110 family transposase n=1 Tax=Hamadaea tsunoensis TaxID=53368 RepID=UPI000485E963|nr:IS110 family transposase [Hamadaea tsunoensis]
MPVTRKPRRQSDQDIVLGVDTHKDVHVVVALSSLGAVLDSRGFPTTARGYDELLTWARSLGTVRRVGVEGTGSYGAALTRALLAEGVDVIEVNCPDRSTRRRKGKSDTVDAEAAARAVISGSATALPKTLNGPVEAMRVLKVAKDSATKARVQAVNQLKSVIVSADPELRESLSGLSTRRLVARCAELDATDHDGVMAATLHTLRQLARRIQYLASEILDLQARITVEIKASTPALLEVSGIGLDSAAALLIAAGDNPHRLTSEASFAAVCGVSPVEASSGKTQRLRLNRGGNRSANAALYRAVLTRLRWDTATQEYLRRRTTEGMSKREVIRCLKRYLARTIYKIIIATSTPTAT